MLISRTRANELALGVLMELAESKDNREALMQTNMIVECARQLQGGSATAQTLASSVLSRLARMSVGLRVQVTQQLQALLLSESTDVRRRASLTLHDEGASKSPRPDEHKVALMAAGVVSLLGLLREALVEENLEAQEYVHPPCPCHNPIILPTSLPPLGRYALWSLAMVHDRSTRAQLV